jgi:hypothetical protein
MLRRLHLLRKFVLLPLTIGDDAVSEKQERRTGKHR